MNGKIRRIAVVGTGGRAGMFIEPVTTRFRKHNHLVALCDSNPGHMQFWNNRITREFHHPEIPTYRAHDFERMIRETRPDAVCICTVDAFHHQYIIKAMEMGCDTITEKPMTIDDARCRAIFDTIRKTGRNLRVMFNYRWSPGATMVKRLLMKGIIGEIIHADMEYLLDTRHGADYFRRWHREKDKSGGLMVHKATHHFDIVNWWLDAVPQTVFGMGRLAFYGKENARRRGVKEKFLKYDRYTGHDTKGDPFAIALTSNEKLKSLYLDNEKYDGYRRDQNVLGDGITIEDTMSVMVKYRTGTVLNYSLNAYLPREGFSIVFNGTKGRLEYQEAHASHIIAAQSNKEMGEQIKWESSCVVLPMFGQPYKVDIPKAKGGHGGSDPKIQAQVFSPNPPRDPYGRSAAYGQGAASALIGIAANKSFRSGKPVEIAKLCPQLGKATRLSELP